MAISQKPKGLSERRWCQNRFLVLFQILKTFCGAGLVDTGHWTGIREAICFDKEAAATEANLDDQWHNRHIVTVELVNVRIIS